MAIPTDSSTVPTASIPIPAPSPAVTEPSAEAPLGASDLLALCETLSPDTPAKVRRAVFAAARTLDNPPLRTLIGKRLGLTPEHVELYLSNPELCYGLDTVYRNLKPGFLMDYLRYTSQHEAPELFHAWVGLTVLAAIVGRMVWIEKGHDTIYPNLYTLLVAPSAVARKSTAIAIGVALAKKATGLEPYPDKIGPEMMISRLSSSGKYAQAFIVASELSVFVGKNWYQDELARLMNRWYDCPDTWERETRQEGSEPLRRVCVSMLGATTPIEIPMHFAGPTAPSLLSRIVLVEATHSTRKIPFPERPDPVLEQRLLTQLVAIKNIRGPLVYTGDGRDWYARYYTAWHARREAGDLSATRGARQPDHILKVATLLALSEAHHVRAVSADTLQRAFNLLALSTRDAAKMVRLLDPTAKDRAVQRLCRKIRMAGGMMTRSAICRAMFPDLNAKGIDECLDELLRSGVLQRKRIRTRTLYQLTALDV